MAYQFPPDVERLVQQWMAKGTYASQDDLLRDALKALDVRQHSAIDEDPTVVEGIRRGLADVEAGRCQPFDEFDAEFRAQRNLP